MCNKTIHTKQHILAMTLCYWEGNRRFDIALAICSRPLGAQDNKKMITPTLLKSPRVIAFIKEQMLHFPFLQFQRCRQAVFWYRSKGSDALRLER